MLPKLTLTNKKPRKMEVTSTRRREFPQHVKKKEVLMLYEQLVVLLKTRSEVRFLCNRVSLSLRACVVAELALCDAIDLIRGEVVGKDYVASAPLLLEAMNKIYLARLAPDELMYRLNGERRGGSIHMKDVRAKVYKSLEEKRICKIESKSLLFNKITISNYSARIEVVNYVKEYLTGCKEIDYRAEVLVVCLIFCSGIDGIIVCMTEKEAVVANTRIMKIRDKYIGTHSYNSTTEAIIFPVLKALLGS